MGKKIAILTAGGDCPGLNAAIRGVGKNRNCKSRYEGNRIYCRIQRFNQKRVC